MPSKPPEIVLPRSPELAELSRRAWQSAADALGGGWQPRTLREVAEIALWLKYLPRETERLTTAGTFLDAALDRQAATGQLPAAWDGGEELLALYPSLDPPLLSWAEWDLFLHSGDEERVARVLPALARHFDWYSQNRTRKQGHLWCAPGEAHQKGFRHEAWGWADRTCLAALDAEHIAAMALEADHFEIAEAASANYLGFKALANETLWDEVTCAYVDIDEDEIPLGQVTAATFHALLAGLAEGEQSEELLRHLMTPRTFGQSMPLPWLAANNKHFKPEGAPRTGAVYPLESYMLVRALERAGAQTEAHETALLYMENLAEAVEKEGDFAAWHAPRTRSRGEGAPLGFHAAVGLGPVAMTLESLMGIRPDAPMERLRWQLRMQETHGVRGLRCGAATLTLYAEWKNRAWNVHVETDAPIEVQVEGQAGTHVLEFASAGTRELRAE